MGWIQFLSNLVADLAWPIVVVVVVVIFREPIAEKIRQITGVKKGDAGVSFDTAAAKVKDTAIAATANQETRGDREYKLTDRYDEDLWKVLVTTSKDDPRGAIMEAFSTLEGELVEVSPDSGGGRNAIDLSNRLLKENRISPDIRKTIVDLALLRNRAAVPFDCSVTESGATSYIDATQQVYQVLTDLET